MATAAEAVATKESSSASTRGAPGYTSWTPGMRDGVILATAAAARTRAGGGSDLDMQAMAIACMHAVEFSKTAAPLSGEGFPLEGAPLGQPSPGAREAGRPV